MCYLRCLSQQESQYTQGAFAHKWSQIEKAILTKDFFFLYVKDADQHIISISNKNTNGRNMGELLTFVESNVTEITKI